MTPSSRLFFEDVEIGMTFKTGSVTIDAAGIRSFAGKFDPQPYHLDRDAADASLFGGLMILFIRLSKRIECHFFA